MEGVLNALVQEADESNYIINMKTNKSVLKDSVDNAIDEIINSVDDILDENIDYDDPVASALKDERRSEDNDVQVDVVSLNIGNPSVLFCLRFNLEL